MITLGYSVALFPTQTWTSSIMHAWFSFTGHWWSWHALLIINDLINQYHLYALKPKLKPQSTSSLCWIVNIICVNQIRVPYIVHKYFHIDQFNVFKTKLLCLCSIKFSITVLTNWEVCLEAVERKRRISAKKSAQLRSWIISAHEHCTP